MEAKDGVGNIGMKDGEGHRHQYWRRAGTVTLTQLQPRVGVAITASVTDLDGDVSGVTWQWSRSVSENDSFTDIAKATSATYKPVADDAVVTTGDAPHGAMFLRATAMYTDGYGEGRDRQGLIRPMR